MHANACRECLTALPSACMRGSPPQPWCRLLRLFQEALLMPADSGPFACRRCWSHARTHDNTGRQAGSVVGCIGRGTHHAHC
jgi:hypothetical protein